MNRRVAIVAGVVVVVIVVLFARDLQKALVFGLVNGALYGLVALGLALIYKSSGVFNFAQGEFGTVAVFTLHLSLFRMPYFFAILVALASSVILGLLVERLVVRPLFEASRVILLVATAGVSLLCVGVEVWFGGATLRPIAPALERLDRVSLFGVLVSDQRLLLIVVLLICAGTLGYFFNKTNLGLAILGASQEPTATELVGISVKRLSAFTWALAALLGGLAGVLGAPISGSFGPGFLTFNALIPGFTAAVVGGMTSLPGAFVGGAIVGVAQGAAISEQAFREVPGPGAVMVFILLLVVLSVRPQGLLGKSA